MTNSKKLTIKKSLILAAALIIGFLMPYLSRIPLAFTYGAPWIWKYMANADAFRVWNEFHLFSLEPIFMFGLVYVFAKIKWQFYAAAFAHFLVTFLCYYNFGEHPQRDDFLAFLVFPFIIGAPSFLGGLIGLAAEYFINRRKVKTQFNKEIIYE